MATPYDTYDYTAYWEDRAYEHESEVLCVREFLNKIPKIERVLEIGGGFGRMVPYYVYRAKSVYLTEPSAKLLSQARKRLTEFKNIKFLQSTLKNLPDKINLKPDLVIMIRVLHHIENLDGAFTAIKRLTAPGGYVILEFANKIHAKAVAAHLAKGDFKFLNDTKTIDVRSEKSKKAKTITFVNHHPVLVLEKLKSYGFEVKLIRSVSNVRSEYVKKHIPTNVLLSLEKALQPFLSWVNFGPSIFILAQKRG